ARRGRAGAFGARAGGKVLRSSALISPGGNLRARGRGVGALDAGGLGGRNERIARAAGGSAAASRAGCREAARRRHAGTGAGAGQRQNEDRAAVDLRARRPARGRHDAGGGVVRLHAGPQGRTSAGAPAGVHGNTAGRWLRGVRRGVRRRADSGSGVLGACAQKVLRPPAGASFAGGEGGTGAHRGAVRDREGDSRAPDGGTPRSAPGASAAAGGVAEAVAGRDTGETVAQIGHGAGGALRAGALGGAGSLPGGRAHRNRQQRGGTRVARGGAGPEELPVRGLGCGRGTRGRDLQPDRHGETERRGSGSVSARGARGHRRPSHQPHRGVAAVEPRRRTRRRLSARRLTNGRRSQYVLGRTLTKQGRVELEIWEYGVGQTKKFASHTPYRFVLNSREGLKARAFRRNYQAHEVKVGFVIVSKQLDCDGRFQITQEVRGLVAGSRALAAYRIVWESQTGLVRKVGL